MEFNWWYGCSVWDRCRLSDDVEVIVGGEPGVIAEVWNRFEKKRWFDIVTFFTNLESLYLSISWL